MPHARAPIHAQLPLTFQPLDEQVRSSLLRERLLAQIAAFFGVVALILAGIGMYAIAAYAAGRRRPEIGIRMALGAAPAAILRLVLGGTARLVACGIAVGAVVSVWASSLIDGLIFGLQPGDPATLAGAAAVLLAIAIAAAWLPARRAVTTSPAAVLRHG